MKPLPHAFLSEPPFYDLITITLFLLPSCTKDVETPEKFESSIDFISA
ncbi:MAG: hypothetical protein ACJAZ3_002035 [Sphingobacteriales bacterium]|jgi:hypothetical protein